MSTFTKRPLSFTLSISAVIVLIISCSEKGPIKENEKASNYYHAVNVQTAKRQASYKVKKRYLGKFISKQHTPITFEYAGRIIKINADNGEQVKKGQILAELDTELLAINKLELRAKLQQLSAERALNEKQLQRIDSLSKQGYSSAQQKDILTSQQEVITATIDQIKANQKVIDYQMSNALLRAPFSGVITARYINQGQLISPQNRAFKIIKSNSTEFRVGIPIDDAEQLIQGQQIHVEVNHKLYLSTILTIAKQIDPITRTLEVRVKIGDKESILSDQIGYLVMDLEIERSGFWLPLTALTDGVRGQWNIYKINKDNTSKLQIISQTVRLEYTTDTRAFITGVMDDKFDYIENGLHRLVPNQYVVTSNNSNKKITQGNN